MGEFHHTAVWHKDNRFALCEVPSASNRSWYLMRFRSRITVPGLPHPPQRALPESASAMERMCIRDAHAALGINLRHM